jgi:putative holliday junction resolvase
MREAWPDLPSRGRILALDIGAKRIGVATCDPDRIVTRVVGMIPAEPLVAAIRSIDKVLRDEEAVIVVAGYPLTLRGEVGPQAQRIEGIVEQLRAALPVPVVLYDERLTSSEARRMLEEQRPVSREDRRRGVVDQLAARLLLDDFLQELRFAEQARRRNPVGADDDTGDGEERQAR